MVESPPTSHSPVEQLRRAGRSVLSPAKRTCSQSSVLDIVAVVLILGYVVALLPGLTRFPPLINDEGREANLFWVASGADPAAQRVNAHRGFATWGTGGLQGATAALIFRAGGVGVFQARLTSLLWGGALLIVVYLLGRLYWNRAVGLAAAALLAVSDPFLVSTHTLRPDIQVATLVVAALVLAEAAVTRGRGRLALLAGLLLGLSVDTHLNTIGFIPMVALVFPLRLGRCFLRRGESWLFLAGLAAAGMYYLGVRVLPDPVGFATAMGYWLGVDKVPPASRGGLGLSGMVGSELARYRDYFAEEPLELGLVLAGLLAGLWWAVRGSHPARLILLGLAAAFAFFVVAVSMKSKYYMLLTYPFYLLLVARLLECAAIAAAIHIPVGRHHAMKTYPPPPPSLQGGGPGGRLEPSREPSFMAGMRRAAPLRAYAILTALVGLAAVFPLRAEDRAWDNYIRARRYREGQEYTTLTARLDALAGPGARILAPPVYWIGLREHPYVDIFVYERLHRQYGMSVAQFLEETRPDFVITDAKIATEKPTEKLLYNELDARATREFIVRHKSYGDVAVYRLRW